MSWYSLGMATPTAITAGTIIRIYRRDLPMIEARLVGADTVGLMIERDIAPAARQPVELDATEIWPWSSIEFIRLGSAS